MLDEKAMFLRLGLFAVILFALLASTGSKMLGELGNQIPALAGGGTARAAAPEPHKCPWATSSAEVAPAVDGEEQDGAEPSPPLLLSPHSCPHPHPPAQQLLCNGG